MSVPMNAPTMKRPASATVIAILLVLAALFNLVLGVIFIFSSFGDNPTFTNNMTGQTQTVSTFYLWFSGFMYIILGLIYMWLMRLTMVGSHTAHVIISVFMVINIIFGFFALGYGGWAEIIASLIVLLIINTEKAKAWFNQNV